MVPFSLMENQCYCHSINVVNCEKPLSNSLLSSMDWYGQTYANAYKHSCMGGAVHISDFVQSLENSGGQHRPW